MRDDIPPDVRGRLDQMAQALRALNEGEPVPGAWICYLRQAARKPATRKRGRPLHPQHKEIVRRLMKALRTDSPALLASAIKKEAADHGRDPHVLRAWIRTSSSGAVLRALLVAAAESIKESSDREEPRYAPKRRDLIPTKKDQN